MRRVDRQPNPGMLFTKAGYPGNKKSLSKGWDDAEYDMPVSWPSGQPFGARCNHRQAITNVSDEGLAGRCQSYAASFPFEENNSKMLFKGIDSMAYRACSLPKFLGRF